MVVNCLEKCDTSVEKATASVLKRLNLFVSNLFEIVLPSVIFRVTVGSDSCGCHWRDVPLDGAELSRLFHTNGRLEGKKVSGMLKKLRPSLFFRLTAH